MKQGSWIMAGSWLMLCSAVVLVGIFLRLSPIEKSLLPLQGSLGWLLPAAVVCAILAGLLLWIGGGLARGKNLQVPLAELILFLPLVLGFLWLVWPAVGYGTSALVGGAAFFLMGVWLYFRSPRFKPDRSWSRMFIRISDLVMILSPIVLGLAMGATPDLKASGLSLFLYPLYALVQLGFFLVIPATRVHQFGLKAWQTALIISLAFGLLHAPNPVVVAVSALSLFIWSWQYLAGRKLLPLAIVMGLSATTFSQFLPDSFTGHMRVGPGYTFRPAVEELARQTDINSMDSPREFMTHIYPQVVGRSASDEELTRWENDIQMARRTTLAWRFFTSGEYQKKAVQNRWPSPPQEAVHWLDMDPVWRDKIRAFGSIEYWTKTGQTLPGFIKALYRDILRRPCSQEELDSWTSSLSTSQRHRLASILLENNRRWHSQPYPGLSVEEMRLSR